MAKTATPKTTGFWRTGQAPPPAAPSAKINSNTTSNNITFTPNNTTFNCNNDIFNDIFDENKCENGNAEKDTPNRSTPRYKNKKS